MDRFYEDIETEKVLKNFKFYEQSLEGQNELLLHLENTYKNKSDLNMFLNIRKRRISESIKNKNIKQADSLIAEVLNSSFLLDIRTEIKHLIELHEKAGEIGKLKKALYYFFKNSRLIKRSEGVEEHLKRFHRLIESSQQIVDEVLDLIFTQRSLSFLDFFHTSFTHKYRRYEFSINSSEMIQKFFLSQPKSFNFKNEELKLNYLLALDLLLAGNYNKETLSFIVKMAFLSRDREFIQSLNDFISGLNLISDEFKNNISKLIKDHIENNSLTSLDLGQDLLSKSIGAPNSENDIDFLENVGEQTRAMNLKEMAYKLDSGKTLVQGEPVEKVDFQSKYGEVKLEEVQLNLDSLFINKDNLEDIICSFLLMSEFGNALKIIEKFRSENYLDEINLIYYESLCHIRLGNFLDAISILSLSLNQMNLNSHHLSVFRFMLYVAYEKSGDTKKASQLKQELNLMDPFYRKLKGSFL